MATILKSHGRGSASKGKLPSLRKTRTTAKPDMKAFAARCLEFQREQFGDRVAPDSMRLMEDLLADRS